jgi:predicted negative regulator of RcsB-dependent stress response
VEDLSEKEQIEVIRGWWRENGRYVVSGIVIGAGLLFGWNYWNNQQREAGLQASGVYESLLVDVADSDVSAAEVAAARLYDEFDSTIYAAQARLAMSRLYMDVGRDEDAAGQLRELLATKREPEMQMVARLRLAKILLYQDKPEEVVTLLEGYRDTAFAARYNEALGDAYLATGRIGDAAEAYTAALADNPNTPTVDRTLIQMKLYDLPEVPPSAAMEADTMPGDGVAGDDAAPAYLPMSESAVEAVPGGGPAGQAEGETATQPAAERAPAEVVDEDTE